MHKLRVRGLCRFIEKSARVSARIYIWLSTRFGNNNRKQKKQKPPILRIPEELLQLILTEAWESTLVRKQQIHLMTSLQLVCKDIAETYDRVWQKDVRIFSKRFYEHYMKRLKALPQSHPMNVRCISFRIQCDIGGGVLYAGTLPKLCRLLRMSLDVLAYFNNGKEYSRDGLVPNLRHIFIDLFEVGCLYDPYDALFPHFMPRTVETLHIHYSRLRGPPLFPLFSPSFRPELLLRRSPIRFPSKPHHLKRLTVTGVHYRTDIARLWQSLFRVDQLIVDGSYLPVSESTPWSLSVDQAYDKIRRGSKGIGWLWNYGRPKGDANPEDLDEVEDRLEPDEDINLRARPNLTRRQSSPSFSNSGWAVLGPSMRRSKSIAEVPTFDFPYI